MENLDRKNRTQMTLRLPYELKELIHREAERKGISFNTCVLLIIYKDLRLKQK